MRHGQLVLGTALFGLLAISGEVSGQDQGLLGCYDLELGAWTPELDLDVDSLFVAPPPRVQLAGGRAEVRFDRGFVLEPAPGVLPSIHRFAFWEPVDGDSLSLVWTNGFSGVRVQLGGPGETWQGYARTFWDFPRTVQTAEAVARRVECDAPVREEDRFRFRFPRGVEVVGGDSIRIGELLPEREVALIQEDEHVFRIDGALESPYVEAEEVRAVVDADGRVRRIILRFGGDVRHEDVLRAMLPTTGEPTSRSVHERDDGTVMRHAIWYGRILEIWLVSTGVESEPLELQILDRQARGG